MVFGFALANRFTSTIANCPFYSPFQMYPFMKISNHFSRQVSKFFTVRALQIQSVHTNFLKARRLFYGGTLNAHQVLTAI